MNGFRIKGTLVLTIICVIAIGSFSSTASTKVSNSCGVSSTEHFELQELSAISMDTLEYGFNEAKGLLAQSSCKDLKPDYCSMGACKDGWKCQANVSQCMCFQPN